MSPGSFFVCLGCLLHVFVGIRPCCAHMSCSLLLFPGSVVLAIVFMPIILFIPGSVQFLFSNFPLAADHHTLRCVVGIFLIVACARYQCCFLSSTVYPMCGAYVANTAIGALAFLLVSMIFRIRRPTPSIFMRCCRSSCTRIATPPWYIPALVFLLVVLLAAVVTIRYPFLEYDMSCGMCVSCMDAMCLVCLALESMHYGSLPCSGYKIARV